MHYYYNSMDSVLHQIRENKRMYSTVLNKFNEFYDEYCNNTEISRSNYDGVINVIEKILIQVKHNLRFAQIDMERKKSYLEQTIILRNEELNRTTEENSDDDSCINMSGRVANQIYNRICLFVNPNRINTNNQTTPVNNTNNHNEGLIRYYDNNIYNTKQLLRLYKQLIALLIKIIESTTKIIVIVNSVYNKSASSSLQGSIIRQQSDALDDAAAAADALNAAAKDALNAAAKDALDDAKKNPPTLKDYLDTVKKSYKNVYKGGKTRKHKRKH